MFEINHEDRWKLICNQFRQNRLSWVISSREGFSFDENYQPIPWFSYPAINFLNQFFSKKSPTKSFTVFEFGCGNSTLYFSKNATKTFSLETSKIWFEIICEKLAKTLKSQDFIKSEHRFSSPTNEIFLMEDGISNPCYQNFPAQIEQKFDLILIDSLKRFECTKAAISFLKPDGMLILDDSQRKSYQKIFTFLAQNNFDNHSFLGIAPAQINLKNTAIFCRQNALIDAKSSLFDV